MRFSYIVRSLSLVAAFILPTLVHASEATFAASDQLDALVPAAQDLYSDITDELTAYTVDAEMTPYSNADQASISGTVDIDYHNRTGVDLDTIYVRLYPNNAEYADGRMIVDEITVDDKSVISYQSEDDTLLTINLNSGVANDDHAEISMEFTSLLPTDPVESYGMFKYDTSANTYNMAHWLPLLAGWDAEAGWNSGPISINGDPVFTEAATFDVTLTAPAALQFATSGSMVDDPEIDGDQQEMHFISGPSRDFDMTASESFVITTAMAGDTEVRSFALPGFEDAAEVVLDAGVKTIETFNDLIGEYPYTELDLVQADIGNGAGGVEFPGMVYLGSDFYSPDSPSVQTIPHLLEFITVHEVLHQWFYGVIGNNQYLHAFLDESMANYLSTVYFGAVYDAETANEQANYELRAGYFDYLFQSGDDVVDQPTDNFRNGGVYGVIVYGKGALAFMELRAEIGTDAFFAGLQDYFQTYAFDIATPEDMQAAFESASGQSLDEFWDHWFRQPDGRDDYDATDYARLLREMGR